MSSTVPARHHQGNGRPLPTAKAGPKCRVCRDDLSGCRVLRDGVILCGGRDGPVAGFADLGPDPADPRYSLYRARFNLIPSDEFAGADFSPRWLIERVMVAGQPFLIAGPPKVLKTTIAIDAAVSLATATPFLGTFAVPAPVRVAVVSGESGFATLQETALRVCRAKGVELADLAGGLTWCEELPTFTDPVAVAAFVDSLAAADVELCVVDPLYLALGDVDARSLFEVGGALRRFTGALSRAGCNWVCLHHANKHLQTGEPMELSHLSYAGLEQFARQFLLLNRRTAFGSDGRHDLIVRIGGSAGHVGLYSVRASEGVTDADFGGRVWEVSVGPLGAVPTAAAPDPDDVKRQRNRIQAEKDKGEVLNVVDVLTAGGRPPATKNRIGDKTGLSGSRVARAVEALLVDGEIVSVPLIVTSGKGRQQTVTAYRIASPVVGPDWPDTGSKIGSTVGPDGIGPTGSLKRESQSGQCPIRPEANPHDERKANPVGPIPGPDDLTDDERVEIEERAAIEEFGGG